MVPWLHCPLDRLPAGLTRAKRQLVVVSAGSGGGGASGGADPLARAVKCKENEVRLTSLQSRLEEGRAAAGLPEQPPQLYSNEDQMLLQAVQWQQQAAERAAQQRAAAAEAAAVAEADHLADDWRQQQWGGMVPAADSSQANGGSLQQQPSSEQLAAAEAALQQQGLSALQAAGVVEVMRQRCPQALAAWPCPLEALSWLQQELGGGLSFELMVGEAPMLLEMSPDSLERIQRFAAGREGQILAAPGTGGSAVQQYLRLKQLQAAAQGAAAEGQQGLQQQLQQQQPAG